MKRSVEVVRSRLADEIAGPPFLEVGDVGKWIARLQSLRAELARAEKFATRPGRKTQQVLRLQRRMTSVRQGRDGE